jgi:transcriptional regulator with XRE-family HTH domain
MILSEQIRAARVLLGWDQAELAARAQIGLATVKRIEARRGIVSGTMDTAVRLKTALETAGIEFIGEPGDGPGVRLWKK